MMKKYREFLLDTDYKPMTDTCGDCHIDDDIHVIEKQAYTDLLAESEKLRSTLVEIGICWKSKHTSKLACLAQKEVERFDEYKKGLEK